MLGKISTLLNFNSAVLLQLGLNSEFPSVWYTYIYEDSAISRLHTEAFGLLLILFLLVWTDALSRCPGYLSHIAECVATLAATCNQHPAAPATCLRKDLLSIEYWSCHKQWKIMAARSPAGNNWPALSMEDPQVREKVNLSSYFKNRLVRFWWRLFLI